MGQLKLISALRLDKISIPVAKVNVEPDTRVFQQVQMHSKIKRPVGEINLLIGANYTELLPAEVA